MRTAASRVLVVDGAPAAEDIGNALEDGDDRRIETVETTEKAVTTVETADPPVDCVVAGPLAPDAIEQFLAAIGDREASPAVIVLTDSTAGVQRALAAGADDVVDWSADPSLRSELLERRLDGVLSRRRRRREVGPDGPLAALVDDEELVALFDEDHRHQSVAGASFDEVLGPERLAGNTPTEAFEGRSRVGAHLDVNYAAALEGQPRRRELGIGSQTYHVETTPVYGPSGEEPSGGVVRFRPAVADTRTPTETRSKVQQLHDIASELEQTTSEAEIFDIAADSADRVLEFDACVISELEDGVLVPRAATAPELDVSPERKEVGEGIAGKTIRTGDAYLIEDVTESEEADPTTDEFGSAMSLPVGEEGIFQAISTETGRYDERDLQLAELLIAHVTNALERVRYQEALTRERDNFAALFENVPDAAVQYTMDDGEPRIESVNSAFVRLFGHEPDAAVGQTTAELLVPDDQRAAAEDLYAAVAAGESVDREVTRLTTDGTRPFLLRSVPVAAESVGYLIYTDLSEQKRRERELAEKNERLDRFASVVSHDLRNPLNVAAAYVDQLRETEDMALLDEIERSHDRALTIIEDVLALARQGEDIDETSVVDLDLQAQKAWNRVDTRDASLEVRGTPELAADRSRLRQLLENLFRNAVEHGGDSITVTVGATDRGFFVADDGPGIDPAAREKVFETGHTTSEEGTGLGLSIVAEIADAHGWAVSLTDSEEGGARFEFEVANDTET